MYKKLPHICNRKAGIVFVSVYIIYNYEYHSRKVYRYKPTKN